MRNSPFFTIAIIVLIFSVQHVESASAPGWCPIVIPTGDYHVRNKSLPIAERTGRPLGTSSWEGSTAED